MPIRRRASRSSRPARFSPPDSAVSSTPSTVTVPEVGRSSMFTQRMSVDLPAPLVPTTP